MSAVEASLALARPRRRIFGGADLRKVAALQVENSLTRYEAAEVARELAQTRLQAEQSRFEVGLSTNFFVVQAQRDLRDAQNSELRALADYRKSLVIFERVQEAPSGGGGAQLSATTGGGQ